MSILKPDKTIRCDVLCVGGSGAAISAAILASEQGAKVAIASKGKFGYSGNAIMAGGGSGIDGWSAKHLLGVKEADDTFTKERLFDCTVKEGYYLADQTLVQQLVDAGPDMQRRFLGWAERAGQKFFFYPSGNWRSAGISWGRTMLRGLKEAEEVHPYEDVSIVEVLTEDNTVTGAVGVDIYTGDILLFETPSVVLGTGGYQPFSMKNTVSDMTGDGCGMAFRAGAALADMEFLLAFPTAVWPQEARGSIYPFIFEFFMKAMKYDIRDKNGKLLDIPQEVLDMSRGGKLSKLVSSYYWGHALDQGLGGPNGGVFYDYSRNTKEEKDAAFEVFYATYAPFHKRGYYKGDNLAKVIDKIYQNEPLEVGLGYEYSMGGILINDRMETGVNGLFAAGETTSGVFGACRVGDGLTEMLCHGYQAGISAARYAQGAARKPVGPASLSHQMEKMGRWLEKNEGTSPIEIQHAIESAADEGFGFIRQEEKLLAGLAKLDDIRANALPHAGCKSKSRAYNWEWMTAMQMENLAICVQTGIKAAQLRKESRGCHIRKDYPKVDHDHFLRRTTFKTDGKDGYLTGEVAPRVTTHPLPTGSHPNVIDYYSSPTICYQKR